MTLKLIEDVVNGIADRLTNNLPAKLLVLDAEYADALVLTPPVAYHTREVIEADQYPIVEVLGSTSNVIEEDASYMGVAHDVAIIVTIRDDISKDDLRTRAYRYARAVIEVLRDWRAAGSGYIINWGTPTADFSPLVRRQSVVMMDATINVQLVSTEVQ